MLLQLFTTLAAAQAGSAGPAAAAQTPSAVAACASAEYHQFDFWAGHWDVYNKAGKLVAHSLIEPVYGCGIRENWMPLNNQPGGSLSIYVPAEKRWEQFWIDSSGSRATFIGGWNGSAMVITGKWGGPLIRMTYSKNADGSVRQFGEQSTDDGQTWKPSFDFTYRPSKASN
ncbi:MAG: hypothetical protein ACJ8FO_03935 [Sphingomicrobium sp.]